MTNPKDVNLFSLLGDQAPGLRILDVGALFKPEIPLAYASLLVDKRTTVVGFEPGQSDCDLLNRMSGAMHKFLPYVIGDGGKALFHRCNHTMTSSVLKPDLKLMGMYQNLPEFCEVVDVTQVETVRLDDIPEALGADYLKLDVQGSEGQVITGAKKCLDSVIVVHTEVEFLPIYEGQPLFGDVDAMLRSHGFMLHRLLNLEGRTLRDSGFLDAENTRSQLLWADAVYMRPPSSWGALASDQLLKLALILHQLYGSADFCARLLELYDRRQGSDFFNQYAAALAA